MQRWKSIGGKSQGGEDKKWEDQRRERVGSKKMQVRQKVGKSRFTIISKILPMTWGSRGSKSNLAKATGAEPAGQIKNEKLHAVVAWSHFQVKSVKNHCLRPLLEVEMSKKRTPLWREAHFQVKMYKTRQLRTTFGSWDVEKVHAVVARSTCPSQKRKKLRVLSLFWHSDVGKVGND